MSYRCTESIDGALLLMTDQEKGWLAGYLEGEGCFLTSPTGSPGIKVCATDFDVVEKYGNLVHRPVRGPYADKRGFKQKWEVNLYGENSIKIMKIILPLMGERRKMKISEIIRDSEQKILKHAVSVKSMQSICHHSLKRYHSSGECRNCYERRKRAERRENVLFTHSQPL